MNLYHKSILLGIAKGLGKPIKVDLTTANLERARFARVCVEVNLKKPLKETVLINGERYYVSYEVLTNICSICGLYGHTVHTCRRGVQECVGIPTAPRLIEGGDRTESGDRSGGRQEEDGFIPVWYSGRWSKTKRNMVALAPEGVEKKMLEKISAI